MSLHIFSSIFWQLYFFLWNLCWCEVGIKLYYAGGMDSITGRRTGIPQAMWYGQKIKKNQETGFPDPQSMLELRPGRLSAIHQTPVPPTRKSTQAPGSN